MSNNTKKEFVYIVKSGKCSWGKCIFCGWGKKEFTKISKQSFFKDLLKKIKNLKIDRLKIFVSGSVLDENQIEFDIIRELYKLCHNKGIKELVLETLPNVSSKKLEELSKLSTKYNVITYLAVGLEVADDKILKKLGKPFNLQIFENFVKKCKEHNLKLRIYILVNAPYTDIKIFKKSVKYALNKGDEVVLINLYPHKDSTLIYLWLKSFENYLDVYLNKKEPNIIWKPLSKKEFENYIKDFKNNPKIEIDYENLKFTPKFPDNIIKKYNKKYLKGAKIENLVNPVYEAWQDYICRIYEPPKDKKIALFLPCAFKKPYYKSITHKKIHNNIAGFQIFKSIHKVIISNPGIIPWEFHTKWPFYSYDWPEWEETEEIKKIYYIVTRERIKRYITAHKSHYDKLLCYLKLDSLTYKALRDASKETDTKIISLLDEEKYNLAKKEGNYKNILIHPLCLENLKENLKKINREYLDS